MKTFYRKYQMIKDISGYFVELTSLSNYNKNSENNIYLKPNWSLLR